MARYTKTTIRGSSSCSLNGSVARVVQGSIVKPRGRAGSRGSEGLEAYMTHNQMLGLTLKVSDYF
jgi:hypothetical protein